MLDLLLYSLGPFTGLQPLLPLLKHLGRSELHGLGRACCDIALYLLPALRKRLALSRARLSPFGKLG